MTMTWLEGMNHGMAGAHAYRLRDDGVTATSPRG